MVFPIERNIIYSYKCYVTYTVLLFICFFLPKMEAPNIESIFECISDGVNKVLVLVLAQPVYKKDNDNIERVQRRAT